jgi:RNA polymerase sigma-70 factor, ECF subfamily
MDPPARPNQDPSVELQEIYRHEISYVVHTLRRLGVRDAELEDVAHDVFVAVHRHLGERDHARPLRPWLFGFCFRIASDHRKLSRHRHEAPPLAHEPADPSPQPDTLVAEERLRHQLLAALDAMDFEKRSLVVMHDLEGIAVPEIAALLAVPVNTAYSRLRLARAELERQLVKISGGSHE